MVISAQTSVSNLNPDISAAASWRSRFLAIILMMAIAGIFWVDSRYPSLTKRYHAGSQVKAAGAIGVV
jgi:hypothetical protein